MNVLMVGGTGCLSSAVTKEALKKGIILTMINRGHNMNTIPSNVELIKSDKNDYEKITNGLEGRSFDAVIDFVVYSDKDMQESFEFYKNYTKQYVFISSAAVYDTRTGEVCHEDSKKVLPLWSYSVAKWSSEQLLEKISVGCETKVTIIRPCVTYGDTRIPYGISPDYGYHWTLAERILTGKPIVRWNHGKNRCNMTRVEDFAIGVVGLIGNPKAYGEAFTVCGDETPSFNDVLDAMSDYLGKKAVVIDIDKNFYANEMPDRKGELLAGRCIDAINSNEKIKSAVPEFKQTIFLKDGIKMTFDAYRSGNYEKGIDWYFDADTDRIVTKWCRKNKIDVGQYNLHFVDYLGNATKADKQKYWLTFHKKNVFILVPNKCRNFTLRVLRKIKRIMKG
jgi:nucleoside-diphosphate-sugar epimerase